MRYASAGGAPPPLDMTFSSSCSTSLCQYSAVTNRGIVTKRPREFNSRIREDVTEDQAVLLVGVGEGIGDAGLGVDDDGSERALLLHQGELVGVAAAGLDGALRDVRRPVRPARQPLPHSMPGTTTPPKQYEAEKRREDEEPSKEEGLPVNGGVVWGLVGDPDDDPVVFLRINHGSWKLAVDGDDVIGLTQFGNS
ncbi:hypothetical protein BHM03_00044066 [Ensete ventricosum]|nr:hypothetical protein BHM03_00044066 [Ensete ventricosum]